MDLARVLQELHEELANLNAAIASLERLAETTRRRGSEAEVLAGWKPPGRRRGRGKADPKPADAGQE